MEIKRGKRLREALKRTELPHSIYFLATRPNQKDHFYFKQYFGSARFAGALDDKLKGDRKNEDPRLHDHSLVPSKALSAPVSYSNDFVTPKKRGKIACCLLVVLSSVF
jgi:hypothetical protein